MWCSDLRRYIQSNLHKTTTRRSEVQLHRCSPDVVASALQADPMTAPCCEGESPVLFRLMWFITLPRVEGNSCFATLLLFRFLHENEANTFSSVPWKSILCKVKVDVAGPFFSSELRFKHVLWALVMIIGLSSGHPGTDLSAHLVQHEKQQNKTPNMECGHI